MRSVAEHLATILATARPIAPIDLGLLEAEGGVLTEDITAAHPLPSFDNSAMDGYALHAADVADAGPGHPVTLPVVGEVVAGDTGAYAVTTGAAVRITTGAHLPAGAGTAGSMASRRGAVRDEPRALMAAIEDQLMRADVLVTSGGVSMGGEHDVVKDTLSRLGSVEFTKVAMQPGMPQGFGVVGDDRTPIFTLPGNPVSAYVSFHLFMRPPLPPLPWIDPDRLRTVWPRLTGPLPAPQGGRAC